MLLNNLFTYKVIESNSFSSLKFQIFIRPDHSIFDGHFPGMPVTPGVCQMEMVKEIFSDYLGGNLIYTSVSNIKFISVWVPNETDSVFMDLSAVDEKTDFNISASIYNSHEVYIKVKGRLHDNA